MRGRRGAIAGIALVSLCLIAAPSAAAATEFGDRCVGDATVAGRAALLLANGLESSVLPEAAPEGVVITRWKVEAAPGTPPTPQRLVVFTPASESNDVRLAAASAIETVIPGRNEFATRLPVPDYSRVGLDGPTETLTCDGVGGHLAGFLTDPWEIGEAGEYSFASSTGVPVIAVAERDRDGDGYGDETQDGCTENVLVQGSCPIFGMQVSKEVKGRTIVIRVTPNSPATVSAAGQVRWRTAPTRKGMSRDHKRRRKGRLVVVPLRGGATVTAGPDAPAVFRLRLGRGVVRRLAKMSPKEGLRTLVKVRATDELGQPGGHLFRFKVHRTRR
jgi:hypothetical protein